MNNGYLGEREADLSTHPFYKDFGPKDWALHFIECYGQIDGSHHKLWVLDQVARILNGDCAAYQEWVRGMRGEWDEDEEGIAP